MGVLLKPGHMEEYMAWVPKVDPFYEKVGVKFHGRFQPLAGDRGTVFAFASIKDLATYEEGMKKLAADPEFRASQREGGKLFDGSFIQLLSPLPGSAMQ